MGTKTAKGHSLKKYYVTAIVASLVVSAVVGIFALLLGSFGETEARILMTTLAIGVFSIVSLANVPNLESTHPSYRLFAMAGIGVALMALVLALDVIWMGGDNPPWRQAAIFLILAVASAHVSLMLPFRGRSPLLNAIATATVVCIAFVAFFLVFLIVSEQGAVDEAYYRLLGVVVILDVLGTIVTPVLARAAPQKVAKSSRKR